MAYLTDRRQTFTRKLCVSILFFNRQGKHGPFFIVAPIQGNAQPFWRLLQQKSIKIVLYRQLADSDEKPRRSIYLYHSSYLPFSLRSRPVSHPPVFHLNSRERGNGLYCQRQQGTEKAVGAWLLNCCFSFYPHTIGPYNRKYEAQTEDNGSLDSGRAGQVSCSQCQMQGHYRT